MPFPLAAVALVSSLVAPAAVGAHASCTHAFTTTEAPYGIALAATLVLPPEATAGGIRCTVRGLDGGWVEASGSGPGPVVGGAATGSVASRSVAVCAEAWWRTAQMPDGSYVTSGTVCTYR